MQAVCKLLMLAMLVGTVMSAASPHLPRPRPTPILKPDPVCDNWCGTPPNLVCCDRKCPVDDRPIFDCNRRQAEGAASVSGPSQCEADSECSGNALCCWDSCLAYKKCTNV
ncbi:uncharacterized protein [Macrobrachium rosenbergii]|uniref:uncharacterized protein isoform X1 n=1 Tax=Macrobrachium rosenbergii TaxID=79674 RepID=UPI0034D6ABFA